jgi:hypothetical protein
MQTHGEMKPLFPPLPPLTDEEALTNAHSFQRGLARKRLRVAVELTALVFLLTCCLWAFIRAGQLPFNSSQWKSAGITTRQRMCADLLGSNKLVGLKRLQVIQLLGKPDSEVILTRDGYGQTKWDLGYDVGGYSFDATMLLIKFDEQFEVNQCVVKELP